MTCVNTENDCVEKLLRELGDYLVAKQTQLGVVTEKGSLDLVTEADFEVERRICKFVNEEFSNDLIVAEENVRIRESIPDEKRVWVIDPLDGTVNYASGSPIFAISLGLLEGRKLRKGWVYAPVLKELFYAEAGLGSFLNGKSIEITDRQVTPLMSLSSGLLSELSNGNEPNLAQWLAKAKFRNLGSQALQLCYVACGRLAANVNWEAKLWDDCAGAIVVAQAGGHYESLGTDWQSEGLDEILNSPENSLQSLACHPSLTHEIKELLDQTVSNYD